MPIYKVEHLTQISVTVEVEAEDEDAAADVAWRRSEDYLDTLPGDGMPGLHAQASFDGIGAESVEQTS